MVKRYNDKFDSGLLILRIGIGIMFIFHGAPKLIGGPERWEKIGSAMGNFGIDFLPAFWGFMAAIAEFGGGIALILGVIFQPMMLILVINMIVAASSHFARGQGLGGASHAIEDGIVFLSLIFIGPGKYTLYWLLKPWRPAAPPIIDNMKNLPD